MAENIELPEEKVETSTTPPDFSGLEDALNDLKDTMEKQFEHQLEEKKNEEQKQAEEKELQEQKELENAENEVENNQLAQDYQEQLLSTQTNQEDVLGQILLEMQTQNEQALKMEEQQLEWHSEMKALQAEGFLSIIICIIVVASVKVFISEVTKW